MFKQLIGIASIVFLIVFGLLSFNLFETVDADEIVVCQFPNGNLEFWSDAGIHGQWFGKITRYRKSNQYWFSNDMDQGSVTDDSIQTRFNDAGTATISGSVRYDMPTDIEHLTLLHTKFGSQLAVDHQLVGPAIERSVFMSGPLMSSRQALSTSSARFLEYIEDQAKNGVYKKSQQKTIRKNEAGQEIELYMESIVQDKEAPNGYSRIEVSPLGQYGLKLYNVVINNIIPDEKVKAQIQKQQEIEMSVQTSIAEMNMATQRAETVKKQGEAEAAKAKWEQEAIKAKEVTRANQEKEVAVTDAERKLKVAELEKKAASELKEKLILEGQGESSKRKLILEADNALEQRLTAWVEVNKLYADAIAKHNGNWVPSIIMGSNGQNNSAGGATALIDLLTAKTAKDLDLNLNMGSKSN